MRRRILFSMWPLLLLAAGCGGQKPGSSAAEKQTQAEPNASTPAMGSTSSRNRTVYTTFYPTQYFAERIGGVHIKVVCPVPEDEDAIFWMPDAKAIQAYQAAALIIVNGAGFEKWVMKVSLPESRLVDTARPFKDQFVRFEDAVTHSHGKAGEHSHEGIDGHTWLDPVQAKIQANEILKALLKAFPEFGTDFREGFENLAKDLDLLNAGFKESEKNLKGLPLLASHPAYNYIARRYGWNVTNLNLEPTKVPSEAQMKEIAEIQKKHPARHILWESAPLDEIARKMKTELGLESIEFSTCELLSEADRKAGIDYLSVMKQNLKNVQVIQAP
ncbi:MAG: zinc ABC transporter substrate-binding protein [Planctomycetota bacterium]|nr:zinc ABC transporter substrate-binding protein [Planctomycetota bacterium]MDA1140667.1 zinc ABC transporter substrate-binding protein [Planctomycetota bacterium]